MKYKRILPSRAQCRRHYKNWGIRKARCALLMLHKGHHKFRHEV